MKRIYLLLVVLMFILSSCSALHWQQGETTQQFLQANHKHHFDLVRTSYEWTVYKWVNNWSYTDPPYYFYFHYGLLYQVDRGERAPDVVIETR